MWIGNTKNNTDAPGDISWVKCGEVVKILGVYFSATKEASEISLNGEKKIENIKQATYQYMEKL